MTNEDIDIHSRVTEVSRHMRV